MSGGTERGRRSAKRTPWLRRQKLARSRSEQLSSPTQAKKESRALQANSLLTGSSARPSAAARSPRRGLTRFSQIGRSCSPRAEQIGRRWRLPPPEQIGRSYRHGATLPPLPTYACGVFFSPAHIHHLLLQLSRCTLSESRIYFTLLYFITLQLHLRPQNPRGVRRVRYALVS